MSIRLRVVVVLIASLFAVPGSARATDSGLSRISVSPAGVQGDQSSSLAALTPDGSLAVFTSQATNLVPGDTNGFEDVFVRDVAAGTIERVSIASDGSEGNYISYAGISPLSVDGRYVVFSSGARNLIPGDTNGVGDVFVRDRLIGSVRMASAAADGTPSTSGGFNPALAAYGGYVVFEASHGGVASGDTNQMHDILLKNLSTGGVEIISRNVSGGPADGHSWGATISADGRYIAFYSEASNLVAGDSNGHMDAFLRDRVAGTTTLVSRGLAGASADGDSDFPWKSADGKWIAFMSLASNLAAGDTNDFGDAFVYERATGTLQRIMAPGGVRSTVGLRRGILRDPERLFRGEPRLSGCGARCLLQHDRRGRADGESRSADGRLWRHGAGVRSCRERRGERPDPFLRPLTFSGNGRLARI